jgi:hypothetical protein
MSSAPIAASQKNLFLLQSVQAARKEQRRHEIMDAKKLLQLNEMKSLPHDPTIDRDRRLDQAWNTDFARHRSHKSH